MQIIITGGAGFLGQRLAKEILESSTDFGELLLVDIVMPPKVGEDKRLSCQQIDLSEENSARSIINQKTGLIFHLAAVVSSHAESDFDLGWKVNLDITRHLLEACRKQASNIKFVFASSLAVYGGKLPDLVSEKTAVTPTSSYGTQKAMGELLVNDYSRKGFVNGRVLRLPTVCVRPGKPNLAASSFVSSIIREPMQGILAICPVSPKLGLWLSSPNTIIKNIRIAAEIEAAAFGECLTVNMPGIGITVHEMLNTLERMVDGIRREDLIKFEFDETINAIVSSWPGNMDNARALSLGFEVDLSFDDFITQHIGL